MVSIAASRLPETTEEEVVMAAVSLSPIERARKNEQIVLQALATTGQGELAKAMGVHESTISRHEGRGHHAVRRGLAHLGLKVVPVGHAVLPARIRRCAQDTCRAGHPAAGARLDWGM
jgi:hypothetical protein